MPPISPYQMYRHYSHCHGLLPDNHHPEKDILYMYRDQYQYKHENLINEQFFLIKWSSI